MQRGSRRVRVVRLAGIFVGTPLLAAAVAACGSSGGTGTTKAAGANGSAGLSQAQAFLAANQPPRQLNLPVTKKPIPRNVTVAYVQGDNTAAAIQGQAIKYSAKILGWKVDIVTSNSTPAGNTAAWNTVVSLKPNVAFSTGVNSAEFAPQLKKLKAMGIPVFNYASTDSVGNGLDYVQSGPAYINKVAALEAAYILTASHGAANTVVFSVPSLPILGEAPTGFIAAYHKWCPSCKVATQTMALTAMGTTGASQIVSYLRTHPSVNWVALVYDGEDIGLPAALKSAGLSNKVHFIGEAPSSTNIAYVNAGEEAATVTRGYWEEWAVEMDAAAREVTHQSLAPDVNWTAHDEPAFLYKKGMPLRDTGSAGPDLPNFAAQLKKIWRR